MLHLYYVYSAKSHCNEIATATSQTKQVRHGNQGANLTALAHAIQVSMQFSGPSCVVMLSISPSQCVCTSNTFPKHMLGWCSAAHVQIANHEIQLNSAPSRPLSLAGAPGSWRQDSLAQDPKLQLTMHASSPTCPVPFPMQPPCCTHRLVHWSMTSAVITSEKPNP